MIVAFFPFSLETLREKGYKSICVFEGKLSILS